MNFGQRLLGCFVAIPFLAVLTLGEPSGVSRRVEVNAVTVRMATSQDTSPPLTTLALVHSGQPLAPVSAPLDPAPVDQQAPLTSAAVEQTEQGKKTAPEIVASFDGLGNGFEGPQGVFMGGNPSDNAVAVGPDHIVQTVNTKMAIFTKKGKKYDTTGKVLYGPVNIGNVFKGFFVDDGEINNGDSVVVYDQLADRWLVVMPVFRRLAPRKNEPTPGKLNYKPGEAFLSFPGVEGQPGPAVTLHQPAAADKAGGGKGGKGTGSYAICYAISTTSDPLGAYHRYMFMRPLFPDYPRPAVWPDGYYVTSSTSDNPISKDITTQRQAYVVERDKMLKGEPAREQGFIIDNVVFLLNADIDGKQIPPPGAPNIMMAAGGMQLKKIIKDDGIYWWKMYVDWKDPSKTRLEGPTKITVAPYEYLGGGQLVNAVPQPGTTQKLDVQGDKLINRLVYRRIGDRESLVGSQSVKTAAGGGGIRWYEFRLDKDRNVVLHQQGTFAPDKDYRWMAGTVMDGKGNMGLAYSFGGTENFPGQRFTGRHADDPPGVMTMREAILVEGEGAQMKGNRWQDYTMAVMDPGDDMTIWYVGDYYKKGATSYSTRIGGFRLAGGK